MKTVKVTEAEGMVLCHDLTQIIPGKYKGAKFKKGHIVQKEDIPILLDMGKKSLYVWDLSEGFVHENDAAMRIALAVSGSSLNFSTPNEGKIEIAASFDGLLKINSDGLDTINTHEGIIVSTLHTNQRVKAGTVVAGTRIIPLVIEDKRLLSLEAECSNSSKIIEIKPFQKLKVGVVTTGSEVYEGRIKDAFGPILKKKIEDSGSIFLEQLFAPDSADLISAAVAAIIEKGCDLILVSGGMSVDPDDVTPEGIRRAGGRVVTYGAPVLPGAMFMMAYIGEIPVMGLPGCVMHHKISIFDLIYPRVQAGEVIEKRDIVKFGHGGMCLNCSDCRYPNCSFGKVGF